VINDLKCYRCSSWPCECSDGQTLLWGDCRVLLPQLPPVDLVLMDPPYGISFESNMHGDRYETNKTADRPVSIIGDSDTELRDFIIEWADELPVICFGTWKVSRPSKTKHVLTWEKGDHLGMGDLSLPWKPNTEEIYIIGNGFCGHRGSSVLRYQAPVSWASRGRQHPHQKPVSLLSSLIAKHLAYRILDPCVGVGSTLVAAKQLGRRCIGIEIEERYIQIAANRLRQSVLAFTESGP